MAKKWKDNDLDYLKRYARSKTFKQLLQRFGTDAEALGAKLAELDLKTKDGKPEAGAAADPVLGIFEQGLRELYAGKWARAAGHFDKVIAETDQADLAERARQFLATCRRRQEEPADALDDPYLAAVFAKNRGEFAQALEICRLGGRAKKDARFAFLAASVYALEGREEEAVEALSWAVEIDPKNRVHAFHDPDFASLRGNKEHARLFGLE